MMIEKYLSQVIQAAEKSSKNLGGTVLSPADPQSLFKTSAGSLEEEENLEETEISEQLSSSSAGYSPCKEESLNNTEYLEDFEPSSFSPTSKETGGESSSEKSDDLMGASVHSIQSNLSSPCCPSVAPEGTKATKKIEVKEAAVQTGSFSLAYHRLQCKSVSMGWIKMQTGFQKWCSCLVPSAIKSLLFPVT